MTISLDASEIKSAFKSLSSVCTKRTVDGPSSLVSFSFNKTKAVISATNEYSGIELTIDCKSTGSGEFTLYFEDFNRVIQSAKSVDMKVSKFKVEVLTGGSKFTLRTVDRVIVNEFPEIAPHHLVNDRGLHDLIVKASVVPEMGMVQSNIPCESIRFDLNNSEVYAWTTNGTAGFVGHVDSHPQGPANKLNSFLVRATLLQPLIRYLKSSDGETAIWSVKNAAYFWSSRFKFRVQQSVGSLPKIFGKIMANDSEHTSSFFVDRQQLTSMLHDTNLFLGEYKGIDFSLSGKVLTATTDSELGEAVSKIKVTPKGDNCKFRIRGDITAKVVSRIDTDPLIKYIDDNNPVYVISENYKYVIMVYGETSETKKSN